MFVKYKIKGGLTNNDQTKHNLILADFRDIMNGTHTSVNDFDTDVADVSSCEFVGSANTSIYTGVTIDTCSSNSDEGFLQIDKRHHHYLTDSSYNMRRRIRCGISPNAADFCGVTVSSVTNTNYRPTTTTNFSAGFTPEVNCLINDSPTFYFYVSDYWFIWQMYNDQDNKMSFGGVLDYDITDHDKYVYDSVDANYSPQVIWCGSMNAEFNTQQGSSTVYDAEWAGRIHYLDKSGAIDHQNTWTTSFNDYIWGHADTTAAKWPIMFPPNQRQQFPTPLSTGDQSHQMVPLYLLPHSNSSTDADPVIAGFKYIWRTTDDIGSPGQTITFNGTDYVVLMGNKTGGSSGNDANRIGQACYLLQKTIGGK